MREFHSVPRAVFRLPPPLRLINVGHLEPIYEQNFYDGSYGFRPGRSPHQAMDAVWKETMRVGGGWILEVDVRKFLDIASQCPFKNASSGTFPR